MAGSGGLWCSSSIYGETLTRPPLFPEPSRIPETRRYPAARLSLLLQRNNRRARPLPPARSSDPGRFISLRRGKKKLSSHYG